MFSGEDGVADTVKAYIEFEKKLLDKIPKKDRASAKPTDVSGAWSVPSNSAIWSQSMTGQLVKGCPWR